jgi:glycine betaine transporter
MLTSKGVLNPANSTKLIWGILQSSLAAVLLWSGGLNGLQTASIVAALPFAVIMVLMVFSLSKSLNQEVRDQKRKEKRRIKKLEELLKESEQ